MTDLVTRQPIPTGGEPAPTLSRLGGLLDALEADVRAAFDARASGVPRGPVTGIRGLDRALGGALEPGLHVLHGTPGAGKTAFALQSACDCRVPSLYVSAEMSGLELFRRIVARRSGVCLGRLKSGELAPAAVIEHARRVAADVPDLAIADATRAPASVTWVQRAAEAVRGDGRHVLLVIDSVHAWSEAVAADLDEYARLGAALAHLRVLARTLACPVLLIAERNRGAMQKGGLSASAGHRAFEYGAESVIELDRDMDKAPDRDGTVPVTLRLLKNRNGAVGDSIRLRFDGALQRFSEEFR
jgi:replicative DNA helicase